MTDQELAAAVDGLSPRLRETFAHLLNGCSEKEIAAELRLSRHSVHGYVKTLHHRLGVHSRGELLAVVVRLLLARVRLERGDRLRELIGHFGPED